MNHSNKKGFTIVELVIVIAVIAILASVILSVMSGIVEKANRSNDTQIVRNMNTAIAMADAEGNIDSFSDVVIELQKAGFVLGNLNPSSDGWIYVWENESKQMIIVDTADDSVVYHSRKINNTTPSKNWFVITNKQAIAEKYKETCTTTLVADDANFVKTDSGTVSSVVLDKANDGDYIIVSGELTFEDTTINKDLTFVSLDGSAIVEHQSLTVAQNTQVTFQNVKLVNANNDANKASAFYGTGTNSQIILDGCYFENPDWEAVQITPVDGADIIIKNCTFVINESSDFVYYDGVTYTGCERMVHIQATKDANCNAKVTLINNTFIGCDKVHNSVIDIDYIDFQNNLIAYGNVFKNMDGSDAGTLTNGEIYICNTSGSIMDYTEAFNRLTQQK